MRNKSGGGAEMEHLSAGQLSICHFQRVCYSSASFCMQGGAASGGAPADGESDPRVFREQLSTWPYQCWTPKEGMSEVRGCWSESMSEVRGCQRQEPPIFDAAISVAGQARDNKGRT